MYGDMICQAGSSGGQAAGSHFQPITRQNSLTAPGLREAPPEAVEPSIIHHHPASSALFHLAVQPFFFVDSCLRLSFFGELLLSYSISPFSAGNMIGHGTTGVLGEGQFGFQHRKWGQAQDSTNGDCRWHSRWYEPFEAWRGQVSSLMAMTVPSFTAVN